MGRGVAAIRSRKMSSQFIRFLFINFEQYLYDNATGTTFSQVNSDTLKKMPVPFPPIDEQQRIVDRVESLFAKLDEAREKAEAVLDGFESRKAAILHKAFTGELTAKWRNEKGIKGKTPNIRDFASAEELVVLINLEDTNADLIRQEVPKIERLKILREKAYRQLELLRKNQDTIAALKKNLIEDTETNG